MKIESLIDIIYKENIGLPKVNINVNKLPSRDKITGSYPMSFKVLNDTEQGLYDISKYKNEFIGTTESIEIYDISVDDYFKLLTEDDKSGNYAIIKRNLKKYMNKYDEKIVIAVHGFLHELGHYTQYVNRGKKVEPYIMWNEPELRNNYYESQKIIKEIESRIEKNIKPDGVNKREGIMLLNNARKYRLIQKEKDADDFAYSHLKQIMEFVTGELNKDLQSNISN